MIKIENTQVYGWEAAIRGARNPMNSWAKSDSYYGCVSGYTHKENFGKIVSCNDCLSDFECNTMCKRKFVVGEKDLDLLSRLVKSGTDHSKFMRMINVTVDVTAPLYWWKEMDTYKIGTVRNSCSTMHKIQAKEFELDDFSHEHLTPIALDYFRDKIELLNFYRDIYNNGFDKNKDYNSFIFEPNEEGYTDNLEYILGKNIQDLPSHDKNIWWQLIQLLPSSYNQRATLQLNYAVLRNIYFARRNHKLDEWHIFCEWIERLPYAKELITIDNSKEGD